MNRTTDLATTLTYEFEFKFSDKPIWVRADVTVAEAFAAIKTGLLRNQAISAVKLFAITEGSDSISFVYDVTAAQQGNPPWSLLQSR